MIPSEIIRQKRDGNEISHTQIKDFITGYLSGEIPDYQMSVLLMAIFFNGMTESEISALVDVMLNSGEGMDFTNYRTYVADKHSTGGVGDKVSIILGPLMAAAGIAIPMLSGRSLGHTGGTLDKLETIPGFKVDINLDDFRKQVDSKGIAMIGQTKEICPADRRIYALRDVTGTIESIPLICGSIMSKKIAEGISGLVLDVKTGNGAFMKNIEDAHKLGDMLIKIGKTFNINTDVVYTSMNQPLGKTAGLWCEVQESIDGLKGNGPDDTMHVTFELGAKLLLQAELSKTYPEAIAVQEKLISNGKAFKKFLEMVEYQGGNLQDIENYNQLNQPKYSKNLKADKPGYVHSMDTYKIGLATIELGCGRKKTADIVDPSAGIEFYKKIGDKVINRGDILLKFFNSESSKLNQAEKLLKDSIHIGEKEVKHKLFLD
ncbi:MAG: thymidine phosphorylase [Candidatus Neomarinimicrobiota bacterium]